MLTPLCILAGLPKHRLKWPLVVLVFHTRPAEYGLENLVQRMCLRGEVDALLVFGIKPTRIEGREVLVPHALTTRARSRVADKGLGAGEAQGAVGTLVAAKDVGPVAVEVADPGLHVAATEHLAAAANGAGPGALADADDLAVLARHDVRHPKLVGPPPLVRAERVRRVCKRVALLLLLLLSLLLLLLLLSFRLSLCEHAWRGAGDCGGVRPHDGCDTRH